MQVHAVEACNRDGEDELQQAQDDVEGLHDVQIQATSEAVEHVGGLVRGLNWRDGERRTRFKDCLGRR